MLSSKAMKNSLITCLKIKFSFENCWHGHHLKVLYLNVMAMRSSIPREAMGWIYLQDVCETKVFAAPFRPALLRCDKRSQLENSFRDCIVCSAFPVPYGEVLRWIVLML